MEASCLRRAVTLECRTKAARDWLESFTADGPNDRRVRPRHSMCSGSYDRCASETGYPIGCGGRPILDDRPLLGRTGAADPPATLLVSNYLPQSGRSDRSGRRMPGVTHVHAFTLSLKNVELPANSDSGGLLRPTQAHAQSQGSDSCPRGWRTLIICWRPCA